MNLLSQSDRLGPDGEPKRIARDGELRCDGCDNYHPRRLSQCKDLRSKRIERRINGRCVVSIYGREYVLVCFRNDYAGACPDYAPVVADPFAREARKICGSPSITRSQLTKRPSVSRMSGER